MKIRYLEHHPDEWLVGIAGLTPEQNGIYRTICDLIASTGGPIPIDDERLFRIIKAKRHRINRIITELLAAHKLVTTGSQLSNNRVISELERAHNRSKSGQDRASKRWLSNGLGDAHSNARAQNQEPITNNQEPTKEPRATRAPSNEGFDRWWEGYPDKVGKGAAKKAFVKALTKTSIDQLTVGVARYKATKPPDRAWCHPATWLNEERWLDVPAINGSAANGSEWRPEFSFTVGPTEPPPALEGGKLPVGRSH